MGELYVDGHGPVPANIRLQASGPGVGEGGPSRTTIPVPAMGSGKPMERQNRLKEKTRSTPPYNSNARVRGQPSGAQ